MKGETCLIWLCFPLLKFQSYVILLKMELRYHRILYLVILGLQRQAN